MKKFLIFSFSAFLSVSASAQDLSTICANNDCSAPMQNILSQYNSQQNVDFLKKPLSAFSGACYHLDSSYDPEYPHYGVMAFKPTAAGFDMNGYFGFFYNEDPYEGTSPEVIENDLERKGYRWTSGNILKFDSDYGSYADVLIETPSTKIEYWIRSDSSAQNLYLIGLWQGVGQSVWQKALFCELKAR